MPNLELINKIKKLKKEKNAICLVHNYQNPEIYEVADFIGDSLGLSIEAKKTKADVIVFCGVHFMAESDKIINPKKTVLLPAPDAGCPMADMINPEQVIELKKRYNAPVVAYVNTTAAVKAESDICCTSANAIKVVNSLSEKKVIFIPDKNLGLYVQRHTDKKIIPFNGHCYVHDKISDEFIKKAKENHPNALVLVHPECRPEVIDLADKVASTSGMVKFVKETNAKEVIVGTEIGMINRLKKEAPNIKYYGDTGAVCFNMKKNNLQKVYDCLLKMNNEIIVPEEIRVKAKKALDRMLEI